MKKSTKFWLIILIIFVITMLITMPILFIIIFIIFSFFYAGLSAVCYDANESDAMFGKYNLVIILVKIITRFNNWLNK